MLATMLQNRAIELDRNFFNKHAEMMLSAAVKSTNTSDRGALKRRAKKFHLNAN